MEKIIEVKTLELLRAPEYNREVGGYDAKGIDGLADSIAKVGLQQPIIVRTMNGSFQVVAGERRRQACIKAGLDRVPCIVREVDDKGADMIRTVENLQREDLHPLDEATMFGRIIDGIDAKELGARVGKSVVYIRQRVQLLKLIPKVADAFRKNKISLTSAIILARLPEKQQSETYAGATRWFGGNEPIAAGQFQRYIESNIEHDLSEAPFDTKTPEGFGGLGSCLDCPKRTGSQSDLFPEIKKKDLCLDPGCWEKKSEIKFKAVVKAFEGEDVYLVSQSYESKEKRLEGSLSPGKWSECKKGADGAKKALIVDGAKKGKVIYATKQVVFDGRTPKTDEMKAKEAKAREEAKAERAVRAEAFRRIVAQARIEYRDDIFAPVMLRAVALSFWKRSWDIYQKQIAAIMGWEKPPKKENEYFQGGFEEVGAKKITEMQDDEVFSFLAMLAFVDGLDVQGEYEGRNTLVGGLKIFGIDYKAVEKETRAAMTLKKGKSRSARPVAEEKKAGSDKREAGKKAGRRGPISPESNK